MAANGNYMMRIGCSKDGAALIGAAACNAYAVVEGYVYPSQFRYRVTALDASGAWRICTPTEARQNDWRVVSYFPAARGGR